MSSKIEGGRIMEDSNGILALLGIPSEKIAFIDSMRISENEDAMFISLIDERGKCPFCGSDEVIIKGYYKVKINNSVIRSRHLYVEIEMRRYKCKCCGKTFKENFSFYMPKRRISRAMEISITEDLKEMVTFTYLARQYDVSTNTIINIFDKIPRQPKLAMPNVLCVDEFHFSNSKNKKLKFPFVMSNPFSKEIIDMIESRKSDYLWDYFRKLSLIDRSNVKYFVSDMNETYRSLKKAFFPDAVHIVDHFHIMKLFNNAIQKIRTKIMKSNDYGSKEYIFLKKHWKMFVCNRSRLKDFIKVGKNGVVFDWTILVDATLRKYFDLNYAYSAREEFNKTVVKETYWLETKKSIDFFIQKLGHSEIIEMQEIAQTMSRWYNEIINAYSKTTYGFFLSNAIAEANNDNIQTLIDMSYGLGLFERMRNRVLYINRNKKH